MLYWYNMRKASLVIFLLASFITLFATNVEVELKPGKHPESSVKRALDKAQGIVDKLALCDEIQKTNVLHIIANRYLELYTIHDEYDARNERIETLGLETKMKEEELERSYYQYNSGLYRSRFGYIAWLSFFLNEEQVETVKNEMTENMLKLRYNAFLDMLPEMTDAEKKRVYNWLVEAREFAMDFITSRKMQQMFTKYRGRINNYLNACGHDLGKASSEQITRQIRENI